MASIYAQFEVDMPDDPKIVDAGYIAELVYCRAIMRCRHYLTDGVIDRRVLSRWFAGIPKVTPALDRLVEVGLLDQHPQGWMIPEHVWRKRNPTKAEVEAKRDAETERKRQWKESKRDDNATTSRRERDKQSESKTETEEKTKTKPESKPSSSSVTHHPVNLRIVDDDEEILISKAINLYAHIMAQLHSRPESESGYRITVAADKRATMAGELHAYVAEHPGVTVEELAINVLGATRTEILNYGKAS